MCPTERRKRLNFRKPELSFEDNYHNFLSEKDNGWDLDIVLLHISLQYFNVL